MRIPKGSLIIENGGDSDIIKSLVSCIEKNGFRVLNTYYLCEPMLVTGRLIYPPNQGFSELNFHFVSRAGGMALLMDPLPTPSAVVVQVVKKCLEINNLGHFTKIYELTKDSWGEAATIEEIRNNPKDRCGHTMKVNCMNNQ